MVEHEATGHSALARIDHLVYECTNLDRGIREIHDLLGVRPAIGGRHAMYGTHNALLSLGPATYLEIVACDPDLPAPERGRWIDVPETRESRLTTWVLRAERIEEISEAAAGLGLGSISTGSRETPSGSVLSWRLTDPYAMPLDGMIPFLISWGTAPHPSTSAPSGCLLRDLVIAHPDAQRLTAALNKLGAGLRVVEADTAVLTATIETPKGLVELS